MEQIFDELSNSMQNLNINSQRNVLLSQNTSSLIAGRTDGILINKSEQFNAKTCGSIDSVKLQQLMLKFNRLQQLYSKSQSLKNKYNRDQEMYKNDLTHKKTQIQELELLKQVRSSIYQLVLVEDRHLLAYGKYVNNINREFLQFKNSEPQLIERKKQRAQKMKNQKIETKLRISKTKKICKNKQIEENVDIEQQAI